MRARQDVVRWIPSLVLVLALSVFETAASPERNEACPIAGEHRMSVVHLYFGRSIGGRTPLTDAEWNAFAAEILTRNFPDGFTAYDGDGQWLDPKTGAVIRERTRIVTAAVRNPRALAAGVQAVSDAYRRRFRQESVGIVSEDVCAAF
jgi:uncharacterized protein DUF3574